MRLPSAQTPPWWFHSSGQASQCRTGCRRPCRDRTGTWDRPLCWRLEASEGFIQCTLIFNGSNSAPDPSWPLLSWKKWNVPERFGFMLTGLAAPALAPIYCISLSGRWQCPCPTSYWGLLGRFPLPIKSVGFIFSSRSTGDKKKCCSWIPTGNPSFS